MNIDPSSEQLIHNYLAGELSSDEETELFERLSSDPSLREELSMQRKMHESLQKDLGSVTIPAAVMAGVFSSVGFAPPKPAPDPQLSASIAHTAIFGSVTRGSMLLVGSVVIAAISVVAYFIFRADSPSSPSSRVSVLGQASPTNTLSASPSANDSRSDVSPPNTLPVRNPTLKSAVSATPAEAPEATRVILNEPIKAYFDIGKFASVDYLTQIKIIGVADAGKIYCSEDGGKSWILQNSSTTRDLFGVNFFDTARGVIVGAGGTILRTTDAGRNWEPVKSPSDANLITVRYATRDTVYTCGAHGTVLRSTKGGTDWQELERNTRATLFKISFVDGANGSVSGERGITFETHDAGATWKQH